jgi:hypothetical protein
VTRSGSGAPVAADALPTATFLVDGVVDGAVSVTVAAVATLTGTYSASLTLPSDLAPSSFSALVIDAAIAGSPVRVVHNLGTTESAVALPTLQLLVGLQDCP